MSEGPGGLSLRVDWYRHPGQDRPALQAVGAGVAPGGLTLVLGASGSGKSTLAGIAAGVLPAHGGGRMCGTVRAGGAAVSHTGETAGGPAAPGLAEWARHVALVPQRARAQLSHVRPTVEEELAFGLENRGLDRPGMRARVEETAGLLGLRHLLRRDPLRLSGGEERLVAIGCALAVAPSVLVLDEPTAGLDAAASARVGDAIERARAAGTGVLLLAHDAGSLGGAATSVVRLGGADDGGMRLGAVEAGMRLDAGAGPAPGGARDGSAGPAAAAPELLGFRGVAFGGAPASDLALAVRAGERVALTGPNGAGKSTLLRAAVGLERPTAGSVRVAGLDAAAAGTRRLARHAALVFQDPDVQLSARTVRAEVGFGLRGRDAAAAVQTALEECGLAGAADEHPLELPATARRLVAVAAAVAARPRVLLLDEPTAGMDAAGRRTLARVLERAAARGAAVLAATHDADLAGACDRRVGLAPGAVPGLGAGRPAGRYGLRTPGRS